MAKDLRYFLKFDSNGRKVMAELGISSQQLDKALEGVGRSAKQSTGSMMRMASATVVLDGLASAANTLHSACRELTDAYNVQVEAETKLETVMRQRMNATDAQIASIKALCSAQQELGVIGDEVQLAGAQQLATFLKTEQALTTLIPAMNNLVAQQAGLSATSNDAVNAGNMLGKVMAGQVNALRRVGITFTEAQKKILETGNEEERAATLAQVITDNVGNMNEALAQTDAGKQKQLANTMGDLKEVLGSVTSKTMTAITATNQLFIAYTNFGKLKPVFAMLAASQATTTAKMAAYTAGAKAATLANKGYTASIGLLSGGLQKLGVSARVASLAIKGLGIASGVGLALTGLIAIIDKFTSSTNKATQSAKGFTKELAEINIAENSAVNFVSTGNPQEDIDTALGNRKALKEKRVKLKSMGRNLNARIGVLEGRKNSDGKFDKDADRDEYNAALKEREEILRQLKQVDTELDEWLKIGQNAKKTKNNPVTSLAEATNTKQFDAIIKDLQDKLDNLPKTATKAQRRELREQLANAKKAKADFLRQQAKDANAIRIPLMLDDAKSRAEVEAKVADIKKKLSEATTAEAYTKLHSELQLWEDLLKRWDFIMAHPEARGGRVKRMDNWEPTAPAMMDLGGIKGYQSALKEALGNNEAKLPKIGSYVSNTILSIEAQKKILKPIDIPVVIKMSDAVKDWADKYKEQFNTVAQQGVSAFDRIQGAWGGIKSISGGIQSMTRVTDENASAWDRVCSVVDGALSIYTGVAQVIQATKTVTDALTVSEGVSIAVKEASTQASNAKTTAQVAEAASGAMAAHSSIPWVGIGIGLAAVGAIVAMMASLPKFAKGGIAYGPTLGLFGEYSGAANNPEVVAPLDRLRGMLQPQGGPINYTFKLRGRDLVATADGYKNFTNRT